MEPVPVDDCGRWGWALIVADSEVLAVRDVPNGGQIIYSTADHEARVGAISEYQLSPEEVIARYHERADTDESEGDLRDHVRSVLAVQQGIFA